MGTVIAVLIGRGAATELMDWGGLASVAIAGLVLGVAGLYINGLAYKWSGRILGGRATYATCGRHSLGPPCRTLSALQYVSSF